MQTPTSPTPWRLEPALFDAGAYLVIDASRQTIATVWPRGSEPLTQAIAALICAAANAL